MTASTLLALAARNAQRRAETMHLIEEYEQLKGTAPPHVLAERLGYTKPASLARRFRRYGRLDLAQGLWKGATQ